MKRRKRKDCFSDIEEVLLEKILKEIKKMAGTVSELRALIQPLRDAIAADVEQDKKVVEAINELLAKLEQTPQPEDVQDLIDALKEETLKLSSDNADVQTAIDKAVPPTPQP